MKNIFLFIIGLFVLCMTFGTTNGWAVELPEQTKKSPVFSQTGGVERPENVIVVAKSGGDFTSIADALASLPDPNTTPTIIAVKPGTYVDAEHIEMKSYVHLRGSGRDITILENYFINITWGDITDVTISGFTVSGTGRVLQTWGSDIPDHKITISGNIFTGGTSYDGVGVHLWGCSKYFIFSDNIVTGFKDGMLLGECDGTVTNNTFTDNGRWGLYGQVSSGSVSYPKIIGNVISDNGGNGIGSEYTRFSSLIKGNVITGNGGSGIYINSSSSTITGNTIKNNGGATGGLVAGVYNINGSNSIVKDNIIDGNNIGILNDSTSSLLVMNNTIRNSPFNGVYDSGSSYPITLQLIGNVITGNGTKAFPLPNPDISVSGALVNNNVFDSARGFYSGNFNTKSDGTPW